MARGKGVKKTIDKNPDGNIVPLGREIAGLRRAVRGELYQARCRTAFHAARLREADQLPEDLWFKQHWQSPTPPEWGREKFIAQFDHLVLTLRHPHKKYVVEYTDRLSDEECTYLRGRGYRIYFVAPFDDAALLRVSSLIRSEIQA